MAATTNTTLLKGRFLDITLGEDGSSGTDWYPAQSCALGFGPHDYLIVKSITFYPSAANDIIVIQDSTDNTDLDGPAIWIYKAAAIAGEHVKYFDPPQRMRPTLDMTDQTLSGTSGTARLIFELA